MYFWEWKKLVLIDKGNKCLKSNFRPNFAITYLILKYKAWLTGGNWKKWKSIPDMSLPWNL